MIKDKKRNYKQEGIKRIEDGRDELIKDKRRICILEWIKRMEEDGRRWKG